MQDELTRATGENDALLATRDDRWYPTFHIAARAGWVNDPNGLSYYGGRHQVFFQHYPGGTNWGPMHWGHVSSEDLVTWRREPLALAPSLPEDADGIFSGSAVVGDDGVLRAYYTGHLWRNGVDDTDGSIQVQCLAESTDGVTFRKRGVVVQGPAELLHFRDPKVWRMGETWYMIVGASTVDQRGQVWLYRSEDMLDWEFDRVLYEDPDPRVYMLECPDLFPLGDSWVLLYSPMTTARATGYASRNGYNTGYVVGDWTPGEAFTACTKYRTADWGHNYYAPQSYEAPDGRRLVYGWMGSFTHPLASQAVDGWAGQLTVPRELALGPDHRVRALPIAEIARLRRDSMDHGALTLEEDAPLVLLEDAQAYEVELVVDLEASTAEQIGLEVHRTGQGRCTWVAYDDLAGRVILDRRTVGGPSSAGMRSAPFDGGSTLRLRVLVDRGSVEVFVGDGEENLSSLSFPAGGERTVALTAVSGTAAVTSLAVHRLAGIWESPDR